METNTKIKIQIKNRWTGSILFEYEKEENTIAATLSAARESGADLRRADLSGANLRRADLSGANLRRADLSGANLSDADLSGADLSGADLSGANLRRADLSGADLRRADLRRADLSGADLRRADLSGADLRRADLRRADLRRADLSGADLTPIKNDLFIVLLHGIREIEFLKKSLIEGKIDGSTYDGECACLSGTLVYGARANNGPTEGARVKCILDVRDSYRPIERFFLGIRPGDTPENNQAAKLVFEWIEEFEKLIAK